MDALQAQLATQRSNVDVVARAVSVAERNLDDTIVRAPFTGIVTVKAAQPGEMVSPVSAGGGFTRTGIGTIVDMDSLEIQVDVNENFINRVQPAQQASAKLNAYPDWQIPAHVIAVIPTADRSKGTVTVRIALDQKDARILPEMGVRVSFLAEPSKGGGQGTGRQGCGRRHSAGQCRERLRRHRHGLRRTRRHRRAARSSPRGGRQRQHHDPVRPRRRRAGRGRRFHPTEGRRQDSRREITRRRCGRYGAKTMSEPIVRLRNVDKRYVRGKQSVEVLQGLSLDIPKGEFVALMGPSGSGKTTLLNLIGGLDTPTAGEITVAGQRLDQLGSGALARWRANHVGFVFQFYNLMPMLSAQRNVELPLLLTHLSASQRKTNTMAALTLVGIADRAKHKPSELSGGQAQRVAIARALVADPTLLVCDEPTGDLDRKSADDVLHLLQVLNREHGKSIVMVTHDPKAAEFASRVLHMDKGALLEAGTLVQG